jgi:hypothetical protein
MFRRTLVRARRARNRKGRRKTNRVLQPALKAILKPSQDFEIGSIFNIKNIQQKKN